jgi:multiple sugar transport system substrate-binding protein
MALLLLAALALSACSGSKSSGGTTTPEPAKNEPAKKVTLRFSAWETGDSGKLHENNAKNFTAKNPNIEVVYEPITDDDYTAKLLTMFAADNAPDVFQIPENISFFADNGYIENLDSYIKGPDGLDESVFNSIHEMDKYKGHTWAFIKDFSNFAIYYNKDVFDKYGVPYPKDDWTYDDFLKTAQALTKEENGQKVLWGVSWPRDWARAQENLTLAWGAEVSSPDGKTVDGFLNSAKTTQAMQFLYDMYFTHKVAPTMKERETILKDIDTVKTGKVAMVMYGTWGIQGWKAAGLNMATAPVPIGPSGKRVNTACAANFAMNAKGKNKAEAWKFLKYLAIEGQKEYAQYALPSVKSYVKDLGMDKDPWYHGFIVDLDSIGQTSEWRSQEFSNVGSGVFNDAIVKMLKDGTPVKEALDASVKDYPAKLAEWQAKQKK